MWVHRINGLLIFAISVAFILKMISYFDWIILKKPHYTLGTTILVLVIIVTILGEFARDFLNRAQWKTNLALMPKRLHQILGWFLIILA